MIQYVNLYQQPGSSSLIGWKLEEAVASSFSMTRVNIHSFRSVVYAGAYALNIFISHENIRCGCSLEGPHQGTSNEYPQHMLFWSNKKNNNTLWLKSCLNWSYDAYTLFRIFYYHITQKYWDTHTPYYSCPKTLNNSIGLCIDMYKNCWMSGKQCRPWSDAMFCGIWSGSTLFAQAYLSQNLQLWYLYYILQVCNRY